MVSMTSLIMSQRIEARIHFVRGQRVMLDADLAALYGVKTKNLNKAVKRNLGRFPGDFMFRLSAEEYEALRFQIGTLKRGQHAKYLPFVFTEQGVAMLSSVLHSDRAIMVNVEIMRTFVRIKKAAFGDREVMLKLRTLEKKVDRRFRIVFEAIRHLMEPSDPSKLS